MRIIGGSRRGRRLVDWEESGIRPVRDFVRSALFSILVEFVPGSCCLDLFAGTGSLGLEAISRGAQKCSFVDRSNAACALVRKNAEALDLLDRCEVLERDVIDAIEMFERRARCYDLVFLDPPYHQDLVPPALEALAGGRILSADPVVVVATHVHQGGADRYGVLERVDGRKYGDNRLDFYRRAEPDG